MPFFFLDNSLAAIKRICKVLIWLKIENIKNIYYIINIKNIYILSVRQFVKKCFEVQMKGICLYFKDNHDRLVAKGLHDKESNVAFEYL